MDHWFRSHKAHGAQTVTEAFQNRADEMHKKKDKRRAAGYVVPSSIKIVANLRDVLLLKVKKLFHRVHLPNNSDAKVLPAKIRLPADQGYCFHHYNHPVSGNRKNVPDVK